MGPTDITCCLPNAPLFTSVSSPVTWVEPSRIHTSWLQKLPGHTHHRLYSPLMPLSFESLDLTEYDIILSISSGMALGVLTKPEQLHVTYLLAPPRYVYGFDTNYAAHRSLTTTTVKVLSAPARTYLRWWQQSAVFRPDVLIPLSKKVKLQAEHIYHRALADPVLPPVRDLTDQVDQDRAGQLKQSPFWLSLARHVSYKRIDVAIAAAQYAKQPLLCIGSGPETARLKKIAGDNAVQIHSLSQWLDTLHRFQSGVIGFWQGADTASVATALAGAEVVIALGPDDFGLVPLEAAVLGTPSVYDKNAGVADVLKTGVEGIVVHELTPPTVATRAQQARSLKISLAHQRFLAKSFSSYTFIHSLETQLTQAWYTLMQRTQ